MSLILDALRKSEAERRRGQSPDLYGTTVPSPTPRRDGFRQWPILAGGALLLLAIALLVWPRPRPGADSAARADAIAGASTDAGMAADPADHDAGAAPANQRAPLARAPPGLATSPARDVIEAPPARIANVAPPVNAPVRPPVSAVAPVAPVSLPATPATPTATNTDPPPPPVDDLPTLAILAPGERAALPPLKLSMHVWNSDPAQRFAIVDGQRLTEGATIGGAVVAEIRRDGVVLDVNGRRVLLPRP